MPPLRVEYAKSGKSACNLKECGKLIAKGEVRIGTATMMPGASSYTYKWRHLCCFTKRQLASVVSGPSIEGYSDLRPSDQELVNKMARGDLIGKNTMIGDVNPAAAPKNHSPKKERKRKRSVEPIAVDVDNDGGETASYGDSDSEGGVHPFVDMKIEKRKAIPSTSPQRSSSLLERKTVKTDEVQFMTHCPFGQMCFRTDAAHVRQFHSGGTQASK